MATHGCYAPGCERSVPARMLMCRGHWFSLPKPLRDAIRAAYRPGQERDHKSSADYLAAVKDARDYLRGKAAVS